MLHRKNLSLLALLAALVPACDDGAGDVCRRHEDCASGRCGADGLCEPVTSDDAGPGADAAAEPDASTAACQPDHDGVVTRAEYPTRIGLSATFRVALDATVDTAGVETDGERRWSLVGPYDDDSDVRAELLAVAGTWYADHFPDADYAAPLGEGLLGVFDATPDALLLLGVVTPSEDYPQTRLTYDPPVEILRFPVTAGARWSTDASVSGVAQGTPVFYSESYDSVADAAGRVEVPFGEFPALRIRVDLTRFVGGAVITQKSHLFLSECYGTVASVRSHDYESDDEFTEAAELRRLAP